MQHEYASNRMYTKCTQSGGNKKFLKMTNKCHEFI